MTKAARPKRTPSSPPQLNADGSLTLTAEQVDDLDIAYRGMYDVLNDFTTAFGDFFYDTRASYPQQDEARIRYWDAILGGDDPDEHLKGWELHYNHVGYFEGEDDDDDDGRDDSND